MTQKRDRSHYRRRSRSEYVFDRVLAQARRPQDYLVEFLVVQSCPDSCGVNLDLPKLVRY